jgi:hypothetical protein
VKIPNIEAAKVKAEKFLRDMPVPQQYNITGTGVPSLWYWSVKGLILLYQSGGTGYGYFMNYQV